MSFAPQSLIKGTPRLIAYSGLRVTLGGNGPNSVLDEGRKSDLLSQEETPGLQHFLKKGKVPLSISASAGTLPEGMTTG